MPQDIVNWEEALNQVGGDREFLDEVMQDLLSEADAAEKEIGDAIKDRDYAVVMRAAHRIKGSASYLFCDVLRNVSLKLQERGHDATNNPDDRKLQDEIQDLYDDYRDALRELKREVAPRK